MIYLSDNFWFYTRGKLLLFVGKEKYPCRPGICLTELLQEFYLRFFLWASLYNVFECWVSANMPTTVVYSAISPPETW